MELSLGIEDVLPESFVSRDERLKIVRNRSEDCRCNCPDGTDTQRVHSLEKLTG
jgi:hypothetical protein